jgi:hypothetical protein
LLFDGFKHRLGRGGSGVDRCRGRDAGHRRFLSGSAGVAFHREL